MTDKFRPEIQGLRAISILAVIFYHLNKNDAYYTFSSGGFIGVDIFFVISGYLITLNLLKQLNLKNKISLIYFYKRIKRIYPVLFLVVFCSLFLAWLYLLPRDFVDFSESIIHLLILNSNLYFHYSGLVYGNENSLLKPLLHTWSLSIEMQYYIFFPIFLFLFFRFFKKYLVCLLILLFFFSLGLSEWGNQNHSQINFYIFPSRLWEFLAGSLLAYYEVKKKSTNNKLIYNSSFPLIGFILICYSVFFFNDEKSHPSILTLIPVTGVSLIILFSNKKNIIIKLLSSRLLVAIGTISYSLYLWHFPILVFDKKTFFFQQNLTGMFIILAVIFLLSILSFNFIEKKKFNDIKKFIFTIIILFVILLGLNILIIKNDGYEKRFPSIISNNLTDDRDKLLDSGGMLCYNNINNCRFNTQSTNKVYIIGDSHMGSLSYTLNSKLNNMNYQTIFYTYGGCLYFPGFNKIDKRTKKIDINCNENYLESLKNLLLKETNSIIIFGGRLPLYLSNYYFNNENNIRKSEWEYEFSPYGNHADISSSFKKEILELSKINKIILIYPIPEVDVDVSPKINLYLKSLPNHLLKKGIEDFNDITTDYEVYKQRAKTSFQLLDSINNENIYRVFPHTLFCNTLFVGKCATHDKENIFYLDNTHITSIKNNELSNLIIKEIIKIEKKSNQ